MKYNRPIAFIILLILIAGVCFYVAKKPHINGTSLGWPEEKSDNIISAVIVPHHDLDKADRTELFSKISKEVKAKTVVLVSTNHFNSGTGNIITTKKEWQLSTGKIEASSSFVDSLTNSKIATGDENAFSEEHGIKNILPDILQYFPDTNLVPIIIKAGTSNVDIDKLNQALVDNCKDNCLLVSSVDFSHYQPGALAEIHDDLAIRALNELDENKLIRAEVDSKETLNLTILWAKSQKTEQFNLFKNTNSGQIENSRDGESTSYVLGYYKNGEKIVQEDSFTFMIGGDMMFDRNIEYHFQYEKLVNVMKNFGDRVFAGTDLSLVNLEGPINPVPLVPETNHSLVFNFQPNTVDVLNYMGVNAVSLANNHTLNNGQKGLTNTKKVLPENGIAYVGQDAVFNDESVKTFENGSNIKLTVITIDCLNTNDDLTGTIKKQKELGNKVLIYPHWGTEYEEIHSYSQEKLAHSWIDSGADFVFGGHPHVIQDAEVYKGKPIFYSMGNLLFDQDFSPETQRGLIVAVKINQDSMELVLLPTISKNYQPELLSGTEKTLFLTKFRKYLGAAEVPKSYGYDTIDL